jgi:hypothetical protein
MFVALEFKTEYKGDKATDWVLLAPTGEGFERSQTWHPVKTLEPKENAEGQMAEMMRARWDVIEPAYNAFKKGEEVPENGTPLGAWGGVNADQAKFLKSMGMVTVESVAEMSDSTIDKLPFPGKRELKGLAQAFLDSKDAADLAAKNAELLERVAAMEDMLAEATKPAKKAKAA